MSKCIVCGCELTALTQYSHGVCIDCCEENVAKAAYIAENIQELKRKAKQQQLLNRFAES